MAKQLTPKPIKHSLGVEVQARLGAPLIQLPVASAAVDWMSDYLAALVDAKEEQSAANLRADKDFSAFLNAVFSLSPHLRDLALRHPDILARCEHQGFTQCLQWIHQQIDDRIEDLRDEAVVMAALRIAKQRVSLALGLADLGGWWSSVTISQQLSAFADKAVSTAVDHLMISLHHRGKVDLSNLDAPRVGCGYTVIAMGKHGAGELNYSSDIDLVVITDPEGLSFNDPDDALADCIRITKSLVRILQDRTEHGYVFRTDLRLRPDPGSMPLAVPIQTALNYYEARGQNWERAAFIKARCVAGDEALAAEFLKGLEPFIWRKYLDYAAISDIHSIKRQIQAHRDITGLAVPGHNVKLGRGGIREIEFFVQTQQLIAGGRNPDLRAQKTLAVLAKLAEVNWIKDDVREELTQSYCYLRDLEHRLQIVNDEQTHIVPEDSSSIAEIANLCGMKTTKAFVDNTQQHLERVEAHYSNLFSDAPDLSSNRGNLSFAGDDYDPGTLASLEELEFISAEGAIKIIRGWHYGRYPAMASTQSRELLTEITPALLDAFAKAGTPDNALNAFDDFLKGLPAGVQLFSILKNNPEILNLLVNMLGVAPRLADTIRRKPHVFDGILDPDFFRSDLTAAELYKGLKRSLDQANSYEDGLDRARVFATEQKFLIGVRALSGALPFEELGRPYSTLAEVVLSVMLDFVTLEFEKVHGKIPGAEFGVVGMGNFGTRELTATSDLDLILLYDHSDLNAESNGERPLYLSQYYSRLGQRLIAAMSAPTSEGLIYELDFRLRPSGNAGPLTTSLNSFLKYQSETAWTWEHLALTRARPVAGHIELKRKIANGTRDILEQSRDPAKLKHDILDMRKLMDSERPALNKFDIKLAKGGLIDIEFLAQWAILDGVASPGDSTRNTLKSIDESILQNDKVTLLQSLTTYSASVQLMRLCVDLDLDPERWPNGFVDRLVSELECRDLDEAEAKLARRQKEVRAVFLQLMKAS